MQESDKMIAILSAHRNAEFLGIHVNRLHICGNCVGVWNGTTMTVLSFINPYCEVRDPERLGNHVQLELCGDYNIGEISEFEAHQVEVFDPVIQTI